MRKSSVELKPIYNYTDYRQYLRDKFFHLKATQRRFSYRAMSAQLGFSAPNFLKLVIDGKRNIGRESIGKISSGLELNKKESEYFSYLVFFLQAKEPVEKNYYFGLIAAMRSRATTTLLQADQFEYLNRWYHPTIREIADGCPTPLDFEKLSHRFGGAVSPARIRRSVNLLLRLGLLKIDENGIYRQTSATLNTENELNSFSVRHYHEQVLDIARKSLHSVPATEREVSSATLSLSKKGFTRIKQRLQDFREELLQMTADDTDPRQVYHVNLQFYPLTKSAEDEDDDS